jgi:hypothetical protein
MKRVHNSPHRLRRAQSSDDAADAVVASGRSSTTPFSLTTTRAFRTANQSFAELDIHWRAAYAPTRSKAMYGVTVA